MKPRQVAIGVVLCGLAGLIYLAARPLKRSGKTWNCQSNLKQIGLGMFQYTRDYDEQFPRSADWMEELRPYVRGFGPNHESDAVVGTHYLCPTTNGYYALNVYYDRLSMIQDKSPSSSPLVFDFVSGSLNQSNDGKNWPIPSIHTTLQTTGNNVLFGDGHVELRQDKPPFRKFAPRPEATATPIAKIKSKPRSKSGSKKAR